MKHYYNNSVIVNHDWHAGWVAPAGPDLDAFEAEFGRLTGTGHALALTSVGFR